MKQVRAGNARAVRSGAFLAALAIGVGGCTETPLVAVPDMPAAAAVKLWESNAAVHWNGVARDFVITNRSSTPFALRGYAIISVAGYNAAIAAEKGRVRGEHPAVGAAIAAASAVALSYLYPGQQAQIEGLLAGYLAAGSWPGAGHQSISAGEAIGRLVGHEVVEWANTDGFFAPGTLPVPTGPGKWFSATPPVGSLWGQARPFFLTSGAQFRPAPPPEFGSPEFLAGLTEVIQISDTRTPRQDAIAKFWDLPLGTYTPPGYWNEEAARLATRYRLDDRRAAHLFALMNMVAFDAIVASHEAKYHYWLLRPVHANPAITLSIPLPNFPSYPSNHATISAGMAVILADEFPAEKHRLTELADEAALSRVLGGIHYRFDGEAGLKLGRQIAAWALAHDVRGHEPFGLR